MSLEITRLLLHSDDVPPDARAALRDAYNAPVAEREAHLMTAARILHREVELECSDARELVGLATAS
jgi:hypothetical protein